ncbi:MAG: Na(+)-translocating NADH-quinone reductase subunit E [Gammaproteobacteria bacterium]|nr:MAG: Na(+)-translocating NADH-quinone reductase subunit E [Gammaproteobacteria bacterium]
MAIFFITLVFFLVVVLAMAVGYIFQRKSIAGSCGGLGTMGIEKACDCDNPCDKRLERERKAALAEHSNQQQDIRIKNI